MTIAMFQKIAIKITPWKINMEPHVNGGLEDDFSFSIACFLGTILIFKGVTIRMPWKEKEQPH